MIVQDFVFTESQNTLDNGSVTWQAPSNIALVKYWGKREYQIPANPSVSFTLNNCNTKTTLHYTKKTSPSDTFDFEVFFEGQKNEAFKPKIETFFKRIETYCPYLKDYTFTIETENTFPHSSGIASSASGMSALALCVMSLERDLSQSILSQSEGFKVTADVIQSDSEESQNYFNQKASFLARLGSGSACRSITGNLVVWGNHANIEGATNLYGVQYPYTIHDNFKNYQDTILLVDKGEKQVSSTVGHGLMHNHPFSKQRFEQAHDNLNKLIEVFKTGDLKQFIAIVESEALTLHAMMMTSMPYFILMKPNTLEIINAIWHYRKETNSNVCFTLDAGANVHVLYPEAEKENVLKFIKTKLTPFCKDGEFIEDYNGFGANEL